MVAALPVVGAAMLPLDLETSVFKSEVDLAHSASSCRMRSSFIHRAARC
jgi:hypothetical protein